MLFVFVINSFALKEIVFNIDFDECNSECAKIYEEELKILIECNNCKIVKSPEYKIIQDGIEIHDIAKNKNINVIFRKKKIPPIFLVYAMVKDELRFIGFFDSNKSKIYIKLNSKIFTPTKKKTVLYGFIEDKVVRTNKYRKKTKKLKINRNNTLGENPLGEGQIQQNHF